METNLKKLLEEFLANEGYRYEETDFGLAFKDDGLHVLFLDVEGDERYFTLLLPGIYEMNEDNELEVLRAVNKVSGDFKVVKAYVTDNGNVNVAFQILADSTPVVEDFVPRALHMLKQAREDFYRYLGLD